MIRCKIISFLFHVFPIRAFQGFLIKNHFEECPDCQNSLAKIEETRVIFVKEDQTSEMVNLWPGIRKKLCEDSGEKVRTPFIQKWKWALSAAGLTVVVFTGFLYFNQLGRKTMAFQQDQFQINYINVGEKPAAPHVYESPDSDMTFVWAEILP